MVHSFPVKGGNKNGTHSIKGMAARDHGATFARSAQA
jgi:hypothetical protein